MATLRIDNLPDELYQSIQTLATNASVSLNDAAIQLLMQATQLNHSSKPQIQTRPESNPSSEKLKDDFLDAIERANPKYASDVAAALTEAMTTPAATPLMDANEFREWLTQL